MTALPLGVTRCGCVAIIGRPNVGKSTLLNMLLDEKIAIATPLPQTTRHVIKGIFTDSRGQIIFLDTPGIHRDVHALGSLLNHAARGTLHDADVALVVYLVDVTREIGDEEEMIISLVKKIKKPVFLLINKMDRFDPLVHRENLDAYLTCVKFHKEFKLSALDKAYRDRLLTAMFMLLPEAPLVYPSDEVSDTNMRFFTSELIREQVIKNTEDEVPHATAVLIDEYKEGLNRTEIHATILVETEGQKAILIGNEGKRINQIKSFTKKTLKEYLEGEIVLMLHVKVKKKWRHNPMVLKELGYSQV